MKRVLLIIMALVAAASFAACGNIAAAINAAREKNAAAETTVAATTEAAPQIAAETQPPAEQPSTQAIAEQPTTQAYTREQQPPQRPSDNRPAPGNQAALDENNVALTQDDAERIALEKAGLSENDLSFIHSHFEYDDGWAVYQVDFVADTTEYEFEIDANSGAIIEYDMDSIYD